MFENILTKETITKKYTKIYKQKFCHELLNRYFKKQTMTTD